MPDEPWRPGDMAECVIENWQCVAAAGRRPHVGAKAMVLSVRVGEATVRPFIVLGLELLGFPDMWDARAFRKIVVADTGADRRVDKRSKVPA